MRCGWYGNGFGFDSHLAVFRLFFFFAFFQAKVLRLGVSVRLGLWLRQKVKVRFRLYLLRSVHFYQAHYTLVMRYYYITGGVWRSFQISRYTGVSIATALGLLYALAMFLPSLLHSRCALLSRYKKWSNNESNLKIHGQFCSDCLKNIYRQKFFYGSGYWTTLHDAVKI